MGPDIPLGETAHDLQRWVMRYDNRFFQLERPSRHYASAQGQVLVCEGRHGSIAIEYRGRGLPWREIPAPRWPSTPEVRPPQKRERVTPPRAKQNRVQEIRRQEIEKMIEKKRAAQ